MLARHVGSDVAILIHHFGCHSLNGARIVYLIDDDGPVKRFGFAYGTLQEHAESGEERFMVEWNRKTIPSGTTYLLSPGQPTGYRSSVPSCPGHCKSGLQPTLKRDWQPSSKMRRRSFQTIHYARRCLSRRPCVPYLCVAIASARSRTISFPAFKS